MASLQQSPWMMLTPDLWNSMREARQELLALGASAAACGLAYTAGGAAGVGKALQLVAPYSTMGSRALEAGERWRSSDNQEIQLQMSNSPRRRRSEGRDRPRIIELSDEGRLGESRLVLAA